MKTLQLAALLVTQSSIEATHQSVSAEQQLSSPRMAFQDPSQISSSTTSPATSMPPSPQSIKSKSTKNKLYNIHLSPPPISRSSTLQSPTSSTTSSISRPQHGTGKLDSCNQFLTKVGRSCPSLQLTLDQVTRLLDELRALRQSGYTRDSARTFISGFLTGSEHKQSITHSPEVLDKYTEIILEEAEQFLGDFKSPQLLPFNQNFTTITPNHTCCTIQ